MSWPDFGAAMAASYPASKIDREQLAAFIHELQSRGIDAGEAIAAVRGDHSQYPPSAGTLASAVEVLRQGQPPTWRVACTTISRHLGLLPYHNPKDGWANFIRVLADTHESIARFAVGLGPSGVRVMPDPNYSQDRDGSFELSRLEREWRETTEEWKTNPRKGLAIERAKGRELGYVSMQGLVDYLRPEIEE